MTDIQIEKRGPGRPSNAELARRGADDRNASLARAEARLREIRGENLDMSETRDKFYAPPPPPGFDYQWKRRTVYNQEDPSYQVELMRQGWEPVPLSRHPEMMPRGWAGQTIEVEGCVLMERPSVLTEEARRRDDSAARDAVRTKEQQLGISPKGHLPRRADAVKVKKSFEPIPISDDE